MLSFHSLFSISLSPLRASAFTKRHTAWLFGCKCQFISRSNLSRARPRGGGGKPRFRPPPSPLAPRLASSTTTLKGQQNVTQ